ncbi:MAG: sugar phosphate isomerase/epimerase [Pirellulaceae bacterium]|nr:sugar phosphate isomerase/epimerase [Pirellulaceae bacterium]
MKTSGLSLVLLALLFSPLASASQASEPWPDNTAARVALARPSNAAGSPTVSSCEQPEGAGGTEELASGKERRPEWRLGVAAYSFRLFTFFEAVDKTKELGVKHIEAYQDQVISKESPAKLTRDLPDETIEKVRRKLDDAGVTLTGIYIGKIPGDEAGCREVFDFACKLGVGLIISEPDPEDLDAIEKFCNEYEINVALHNHPEGRSKYWDPKYVRELCEGRGPRIGACADIGHWQRSGIKPIDGVRVLGDRILSFHIKDLNKFGQRSAHDVPWGTGKGGLAEVFAEVHRLGIEPAIFGIEYEHHWENSMPEIAKCVAFFRKVVSDLEQADVQENEAREPAKR